VGNNFALGLGIPLYLASQSSTSSKVIISFVDGQQVDIKRMTRSEVVLSLLLRGYFGKGKFRPFLQAQPGVSRLVDKTVYRTVPERRYSQINAALSGGPGLTYFITDHVGVEALLNAVYNDDVRNFPPTSFGLYFGLQFYLPKR
jgi:hypothetical protein